MWFAKYQLTDRPNVEVADVAVVFAEFDCADDTNQCAIICVVSQSLIDSFYKSVSQSIIYSISSCNKPVNQSFINSCNKPVNQSVSERFNLAASHGLSYTCIQTGVSSTHWFHPMSAFESTTFRMVIFAPQVQLCYSSSESESGFRNWV